MEAGLWNALVVTFIKDVARFTMSDFKHAVTSAIESIAEVANFAFTDTSWHIRTYHIKSFRAFGHASELEELETSITCCAVVPVVHALRATRCTFSTDIILSERDPYVCCSHWAMFDTFLCSFDHLEALTALCADLSVFVRASQA